jgi:hypothetical protein
MFCYGYPYGPRFMMPVCGVIDVYDISNIKACLNRADRIEQAFFQVVTRDESLIRPLQAARDKFYRNGMVDEVKRIVANFRNSMGEQLSAINDAYFNSAYQTFKAEVEPLFIQAGVPFPSPY